MQTARLASCRADYTDTCSVTLMNTIFSIGHSTRSLDTFLSLLEEYRVAAVADVRRFPGSRRYPHFNADMLAQALGSADIYYEHMPGLGGRRRPLTQSPNTGWRNEAFRGYADYMATPEFGRALGALTSLSRERRAAMLCSEAVWWRCHRRLIADALLARGIAVEHILGTGSTAPHTLTPFARVDNLGIAYPGQ